MRYLETTITKWILILSGIFALLEIMVSVSLWISPGSVLENVDMQARGMDYVIQMWSARQFAIGFIFGFATLRKSVPMLALAYVFFLVMFVGDLIIGISNNENPLVISAVVMCIVSGVMIYVLTRTNVRR